MDRGESEDNLAAQDSHSETVGFRLSPQQERLLRPDEDRPVTQCAVVLSGPVVPADLRSAMERAAARHEILRTTFPRAVGMRDRSQVIHDSLAPGWRTDDGRTEDATQGADAALAALLAGEAEQGFDLDAGPLLRAVLVGAEQERCLLILTAHAACADAASLLVLLDELAPSDGHAGDDAEPVQYADYAEWRHELIGGGEADAVDGRTFWTEQAEERPAPPRLLFATPQASPGRSTVVPVALDADQIQRLREAAAAALVAPALFLEACWHALIARLSGADELMLAGWCDGRGQAELGGAVGPYAQPVPIRSRYEDSTSFAEVLDQVSRARATATRWQDYASATDLEATRSGAAGGFAALESRPARALAALRPSADIPLLLCVRTAGDALTVELWRDPAVYADEDAADLAGQFATLLAAASSDSARPVMSLPLTDDVARGRILEAAAGPVPEADARTPVHHLFERQAQLTPGDPAVGDAGGDVSYAALNAAANRLAGMLRELGADRRASVGLCLERSPRLLEAVLAILKAGGAYVPLNYEHPSSRLLHQLAESGAPVLVTEQHLLEHFAGFDGEIVCVDRDAERIAACPEADPEHLSEPEDPVYVMYTSGSTGLPKGVVVTHANLGNYATHVAGRLNQGRDGATGLRFGVVSAISTDLGNTSIFPPLVSGGCVHLVSPGASMDGALMVSECAGRPLDVLKITPSHLGALLEGENAGVLPREWLVIGGEALSWDLVARIRGLSAGCRIVNHYGPTETTIGCCAHDVEEPREDAATVPIGRPLAGVRAYVLDRALGLLPPGVPGELCVAGDGVAQGYVGRSDSEPGPFIDDPFLTAGAGRMYRTGDRVRRLRDGTIEFLGRVDDQVKIRGFRIEPGEIEAVLARHPAVRQAAVVPEPDERGQLRLVAYFASSAEPAVEELQAFLADALPEYMIPAGYVTLDALPFTPSGKVDRGALHGLTAMQTRREAQYVAPRDPVEVEIAAIWAELLGVEQVGVHDDFFALGGHSLLATQAIMRIRRTHGDIPLRALLTAPTVADIAELVRSSAAAQA
jgi:amino acid adenylation domain-containing protein